MARHLKFRHTGDKPIHQRLLTRKVRGDAQERLAGNRREPAATSLPPHVHNALLARAEAEGKSLSRVRAEIIYESLGLDETGWFAKGERKKA